MLARLRQEGKEQLAIRDSLVAPAGTTHYLHDIFGNVIAETDGTGPAGTVREYIWLAETEIAPTMGSRTTVDRPLAVVDAAGTSPAIWFVHVDHLNRPVKMTDGSKAVVWSAVWTPWGAPQSLTGSATLNARFAGQWFQVEAGLHYNWHRHYDPTLGRYTQTDPLGFVDGPSVFGYVRGAPGRFVDKDGRNVPLSGLVPWCVANPALCAIVLAPPAVIACYGIYKDWTRGNAGGGGGGNEDDDDNDCEEQDRADRACCMSAIVRRHRAICHAQASERYSACLTKRPVPRLGWCGR